MKSAIISLVILACVTLTTGAQADTIAASLYEEGVTLLKEKKFEEACDKLAASFDREQLSGTLMVLAQCHELQGKTATAWDEYERAAALAASEGRAEYEKTAKEQAQKLVPKLSRLKIVISDSGQSARVTLAGEPVAPATFGVALAMDPGPYEIRATAEGFRAWSKKVHVNEPGKTVTVTIPRLEPSADVAPNPLPAPVGPAPTSPVPAPPPDPDRPVDPGDGGDGGVPAWAWVAGGLGVASAVVSFVFLGINRGVAADLDGQCGGEPRDDCPPRDQYDAEGDHDTEKLSSGMFIGFGIGAVAGIGIGIVGIIVGASGSDEQQSAWIPVVSPEGGGLTFRQRF